MGSTIYSLRSFAMYAGNRTLVTSWLPLYFAAPMIGALLGQLFYVLLRAGFVSPSAPTADISPYGFAAIAGLGGLFSAQALEKLKSVFEEIFTKLAEHSDPVVQPPTISDISPTHAKEGNAVTITGTGLAKVNRVVFFDGIPAVLVGQATDTSLTVNVPHGAAKGPIGIYDTAGMKAESPGDFTVDP